MKNTQKTYNEIFIVQGPLKGIFSVNEQDFNELSLLQKTSGFQLSTSEQQLKWLKNLHFEAFTAESQRHWKKADFFLNRLYAALRHRYWKKAGFWTDLQQQSGIPDANIKLQFLESLLLNFHLAFYSTLDVNDQPEDKVRALEHLNYIKRLKTFLSAEEYATLEDDIDRLLVHKNLEGNHLTEAMSICEKKIQAKGETPSFFFQKLTQLYFDQAIRNGEGNNHSKNITHFRKGINHLEKLRKSAPLNVKLYDLIGILKYRLSISQANTKKYAEALGSVEEAIFYNPSFKEFYDFRAQLEKIMKDLKSQMAQLIKSLGYNQRLNAEGEKLKIQANKGFSLAQKFANSDQAKELVAQRNRSYYLDTWTKLTGEKDIPDTEAWEDISKSINILANQLLKNADLTVPEISAAWQAARTDDPRLHAFEEEKFVRFITNIRYPKEEEEVLEFSSPLLKGDIPQVVLVEQKTDKKSIPFHYWMASRRGWLAKAMAVAAIFLLVFTGILTLSENRRLKKRDVAYTNILQDLEQNAEFTILSEHINDFLKNRPKVMKDKRENFVLNLYEKSFSDWFFNVPDTQEEIAEHEFKRFKSLIN